MIFTPPSFEDISRLLKAWRFWVLGAMMGALIGVAVYQIVPPPYRAKATVNVDFNLEEAFPGNSDRQDFYYLEREARKMEELAWADEIMTELSSAFALPAESLRGGKLQLSQPAEAGWHFYADDSDPQIAALLAKQWVELFEARVQEKIEMGEINSFVKIEVTQSGDVPVERSIPMSGYLLAGSFGFLTLAVFVILFLKPRNK